MTLTRRTLLAATAAGSVGTVVQQRASASSSSAAAGWFAVPQPSSLMLCGGSWIPSNRSRIRVYGKPRSPLHREAIRLSSELSQLAGIDPPQVVFNAGKGAHGDVSLRLQHDLGSEEFVLRVERDRVQVSGGSAAAVFYATRQIVQNLRAQGLVPQASIRSEPAVAERGLHLDLARKHYSLTWIRARIRQLADLGFNTVQLHFSEHEGFRIQSDMPGVASAQAHTKAEIRDLILYAGTFHLRVIPAFDMPGHLSQALTTYPQYRLPNSSGGSFGGALDITNPSAVAWAKDLVDEFSDLFEGCDIYNLAGDEFVPNMDQVPALVAYAERRYGSGANGHDALYGFVNDMYEHLAAKSFSVRCWNDGMWRGAATTIDPRIDISWWTNWSREMKPAQTAIDHGHRILNCNDAVMYYVLGQNAGYTYPTAEKFWKRSWHQGVLPSLPPNGAPQIWEQPYPEWLIGTQFCIWSDKPLLETEDQVAARIQEPLRAKAERSWNAGSRLSLEEFGSLHRALPEGP